MKEDYESQMKIMSLQKLINQNRVFQYYLTVEFFI
jgi:hypothetical protein